MPFRDDLLTPIEGDNPSGIDLRYDPVRDDVKEARREEIEAPQGVWKTEVKPANWKRVIDLASKAIATRSKDLQLAVWLVEAHVRTEGFTALKPGFEFLRALVDTFWDTLYPEIDDGDLEERAAILSWLGSKLDVSLRVLPIIRGGFSYISYKESRTVGSEEDASSYEAQQKREKLIAEGKTSPEQWDSAVEQTPKAECEALQAVLQSALESLQALNATCDERFGRDAPSFTPTKQALEDIAGLVRGFINKKGGPAAQPEAVAPPPPPPPAPAHSIIDNASEPPAYRPPEPTPLAAVPVAYAPITASIDPSDVADAEARIVAASRFLRTNSPSDSTPYLILRGLRFGQTRDGGADSLDESRLHEPPPGMRAELRRLYAQQDWDALLEASERAMELPCGRGWLDLQFYTAKALESKGGSFQATAEAVRSELRGLLTDRPKLLHACLADGTPTANPETQKWVEEQITSAERSHATPAPAVTVVEETPTVRESVTPPLLDVSEVEQTGDPVFEQALESARRGQVADAVSRLSHQLEMERSGRKRFVRRVQIAHLLVAAGQSRVALPFLHELASEIESRSLESWEDSTGLAYPLTLLWQCLNGETSEAERAKLYARICRLDPMRALSMELTQP